MTRKLPLLLCAACTVSFAQSQATLAGPVAGFVFDQSARAIRPMIGVAGAAYLGPAVVADLDAAAIAPDGNSALVVRGGRMFQVTHLRSAGARERHGGTPRSTIADAIAGADRIVWRGDTAAAYASATGQAQVLRNPAATPAAGPVIDLSTLPGAVTTLAANGDDLLVGIAGSGVYRVPAGGPPQLLAPALFPADLRVSGADLYFADRDGGQIWQIPAYAAGSTPIRFAGDLDTPIALHLDSGRLFVASAGGRTLSVYDLATHAPTPPIGLAFTPVSLEPMGSVSLLLMAPAASEGAPIYVLDLSQDPAVYFVPAQGVAQ